MDFSAPAVTRPPDHRASEAGLASAGEAAAPSASAVSWGAILAGAAAAAALSLILLLLGTGLGLSSISPWAQRGVGAAAFGISTIVWVTVTQLLSSGMGGYLAGRLRSKWAGVQGDEVYFRDTAHGFLSWAVASLATAALLGSVVASVVGGGLQAGAGVLGAAAGATASATVSGALAADRGDTSGSPAGMGYFMDSLFRGDATPAAPPAATVTADETGSGSKLAPSAAAPAAPPLAEVSRIFINSIASGSLPPDDLRYVGQLVAQRTGLPQADAQQRVSQAYTRLQATMQQTAANAREAADKARKATVYASLWLFVALLAGAFVASLAATYGGRERDL